MEIAISIIRWVAAIPLALLGSDFCGMLLSFLTWGIRHLGERIFGDSIDNKLQEPFVIIDRFIVAVLFVVFGYLIVPAHNVAVVIALVVIKVWVDFQRGYFLFQAISSTRVGPSTRKTISISEAKGKLLAIVLGDGDTDCSLAKDYSMLPAYVSKELFREKLIQVRAFAFGLACKNASYSEWQQRSDELIDDVLNSVDAQIAELKNQSLAVVKVASQDAIKHYSLSLNLASVPGSTDSIGIEVGIGFRMLLMQETCDALERLGRGTFYQAFDQVTH